jgi:hypothetical protein
MHQMSQEAIAKIAQIIAEAAKLPLNDAAFALWRQKSRLDTLEGRPTPEEVRAFRAMTPKQQAAKLKHDRDHADEGPIFVHLKQAHPHTSDADIRKAILTAVRFDTDCFRFFKLHGDFWDCCVRAVAVAAKRHPNFLEQTYKDARNHVAYYMK